MHREMTAVIIDDEDGNRAFLLGLLKTYCPHVKVIGEAQNIQEGLKLIQRLQPNLLFLDILMPKGSGFELLDRLEDENDKIQVIFTTAHDQYAVRAFRYSAQDYLLKPIHPIQLQECVERASTQKEKIEQLERIKYIHDILGDKPEPISSIIIRSWSGQTKIIINGIIRCEADSNYTLIHLADKASIVATKSLKEFDELLSPFRFLRVHQSHLINLNKFEKYSRNKDTSGGHVILTNGDIVEVSRSKKKVLLQSINS